MLKLTDTQMLVLAAACERRDGIAVRPEALNRTAVVKVAAKLLEKGLAQEVPAKLGWPIWRLDDQGKAFSLQILKPGREIVKAAGKSGCAGGSTVNPASRLGQAIDVRERVHAEPTNVLLEPKPGTKRNLILAMMQRDGGATIGDLMSATGWLPHTTRAALTGLRKSGIVIERTRDPLTAASVYRMEPSASTSAAG